jgi:hypothetical protein
LIGIQHPMNDIGNVRQKEAMGLHALTIPFGSLIAHLQSKWSTHKGGQKCTAHASRNHNGCDPQESTPPVTSTTGNDTTRGISQAYDPFQKATESHHENRQNRKPSE